MVKPTSFRHIEPKYGLYFLFTLFHHRVVVSQYFSSPMNVLCGGFPQNAQYPDKIQLDFAVYKTCTRQFYALCYG